MNLGQGLENLSQGRQDKSVSQYWVWTNSQFEGQGKLKVRSQTDYDKRDVHGYQKVAQDGRFSVSWEGAF